MNKLGLPVLIWALDIALTAFLFQGQGSGEEVLQVSTIALFVFGVYGFSRIGKDYEKLIGL